MSIGHENSAWLIISLISMVSVLLLTWLHLFKSRDQNQTYIGTVLLPVDDFRKSSRGLNLSKPWLFLLRMITSLALIAISSSPLWELEKSEYSLVLTDGPIQLDLVQEKNKYKIKEDRLGLVHSEALPQLFEQGKLSHRPRLLGLPDPLSVIEKELSRERFHELIVKPSQSPLVHSVRATWERTEKGEPTLLVQALIDSSQREASVSVLIERFVLDPSQNPKSLSLSSVHKVGEWRSIGEMRELRDDTRLQLSNSMSLTRWEWRDRSEGDTSTLSEAPLRIRLLNRQGDHLLDDPYPLCTPKSTLSIIDQRLKREVVSGQLNSDALNSALSEFGFTFVSEEQREGKELRGALSWRVWLGDPLTQLNKDELKNITDQGQLWTPHAPISRLIEYPPTLITLDPQIALSLPNTSSALIHFHQSTPISKGAPLLWMGGKANGSNSWKSEIALATWNLESDGSRKYHFGLPLNKMSNTSALGIALSVHQVLNQEREQRGRCIEWLEGSPLISQLPEKVSLVSINSQGFARSLTDSKVDVREVVKDLDSEAEDFTGRHQTLLKTVIQESRNPSLSKGLLLGLSHAKIDRYNAIEQGLYMIGSPVSTPDRDPLFIVRRPLIKDLSDERETQSRVHTPPQTELIQDKEQAALNRIKPVRFSLEDFNQAPLHLIQRVKSMSPGQQLSFWLLLILVALSLLGVIAQRGTSLVKSTGWAVIFFLLCCLAVYGQRWYINRLPSVGLVTEPIHREHHEKTDEKYEMGNKDQVSLIRTFLDSKNVNSPNILNPHQESIMLIEDRQRPFTDFEKGILQEHHGAKWLISPSLENKLSSQHAKTEVKLESSEVKRDQEDQRILIKLYLSSNSQDNVEVDLYIEGVRESLRIPPQGLLYGRWIKDRDQRWIGLKIEPTSHSHQISGTDAVESFVLVPPHKRKAFWVWGQGGDRPLRSTGAVSLPTPSTALDHELPKDLQGVILHQISPDLISDRRLERLHDWVHEGGTLFISGRLTDQERKRSLLRESSEKWRSLTPLSSRLPIRKDRTSQVMFLLDRSGSTAEEAGGPGLAAITTKLSNVVAELAPKEEVTLISFGGGVDVTLPPTERQYLTQLPVPTLSRGGTELHPAVELALTYRRPSLPAHLVILTDGEWSDDPTRLKGSMIERLEASGFKITIALYENRRHSVTQEVTQTKTRHLSCKEPCQSFSLATHAEQVWWSDFGIDQLQNDSYGEETTKLSTNPSPLHMMNTEVGTSWSVRVGGVAPPISEVTPMRARLGSTILASADGYPLLAERSIGEGRVIQLAANDWSLSTQQWRSLLGAGRSETVPWRVSWSGGNHEDVALWSNERGPVAQVFARSHNGILSEEVTLRVGERVEQLYWTPRFKGESVLSQCHSRESHISTENLTLCSPRLFEVSDPTIYQLGSRSNHGPSIPISAQLSRLETLDSGPRLGLFTQLIKMSLAERPLSAAHTPRLISSQESLANELKAEQSRHLSLNQLELFELFLLTMLLIILGDCWFWSREA